MRNRGGLNTHSRIPFAGAYRAAATLAIVAYHVWLLDVHTRHASPPGLLVLLGPFGVACFFALSGFLLSRPFIAALRQGTRLPSLRMYALGRFLRIYPLYAFLVVAIAALQLSNPGERVAGVGDVLAHLTFAFASFHSMALTIDPPMWTMAADVQFYVALPLIALCALGIARKAQPKVRAGVLVLLTIALVVLSGCWNVAHAAAAPLLDGDFAAKVVALGQLPGMFVAFGSGMLAAAAFDGTPLESRKRLGSAALVLALPFLYLLPLTLFDVRSATVVQPIECGLCASLVLLAGVSLLPYERLENPVVRWAERLSYGIYLVHFFAIQFCAATWTASPVIFFIVTLVSAYVLSAAVALPLYLWVERPFLSLKREVTKSRARSAIAATP